ncbi:MAG: hypothetical protein MUC69_04840, partial [Gemmatimonadales bacterium]|nr:hypothetical protein [Gemmatimonadales bacterium]
PEPTGPTNNISSLITAVSASNGTVAAVLQPGLMPVGPDGPSADVAGISSVVNGGSAQVQVTSAGSFDRVVIGIDGVDGYWDVTLPAGVSAEDLVLSMSTTLNAVPLQVQYAVGSSGVMGPAVAQDVRVIRVGTGDVQVSVAWSGATDVDLHVIDPTGERIYFGNANGQSGGRLDLDSNPACNIDNKNNENVVWPTNGAPTGEYQVQVHYFADCGVARTDWVVTIQVKGQAPRIHTGSFSGASNGQLANLPVFTY